MKKSTIIIIAVVAVIAILVILGVSAYNGMISKRETVDSSLSNLDVMLQRRADLVPNLVNTVKGYASHEKEAIDSVTEARTKMVNAGSVGEKAEANNELSKSLNALMLVVENYPDLKASTNFVQLSDELAGTENRIAVARKDYNDSVKTYNTTIIKFPNSIFAGIFGFEKADYFEADEASAGVPSVNFD